MSTFDNVWASTNPEAMGDNNPPPPPGMYNAVISEGKWFSSNAGELTMVVGYRKDDGYTWSDVRTLTQNGQPKEGAIKAAKILLRQLGIPEQTPPGAMPTALKNLVGRAFIVETVASKQVKQDGSPYINTNVSGPGTPPQAAAPVSPAQAPEPQFQMAPAAPTPQPNPQFAQPQVQQPAPQAQGFPVAPPIDGSVLPQQPAPGAQFGDDVPWT